MKYFVFLLINLFMCFGTSASASVLTSSNTQTSYDLEKVLFSIPESWIDMYNQIQIFGVALFCILIIFFIFKYLIDYIKLPDDYKYVIRRKNLSKYMLINILLSLIVAYLIAYLPICYTNESPNVDGELVVAPISIAVIRFLGALLFASFLTFPLLKYRHNIKKLELRTLNDEEYINESKNAIKNFIFKYIIFGVLGFIIHGSIYILTTMIN